jgi:hypothetical protein
MRMVYLVRGGAAVLLSASLAMEVENKKHLHAESYHGAPQATRPLESVVSTATVIAIPMFNWDLMDFR